MPGAGYRTWLGGGGSLRAAIQRQKLSLSHNTCVIALADHRQGGYDNHSGGTWVATLASQEAALAAAVGGPFPRGNPYYPAGRWLFPVAELPRQVMPLVTAALAQESARRRARSSAAGVRHCIRLN